MTLFLIRILGKPRTRKNNVTVLKSKIVVVFLSWIFVGENYFFVRGAQIKIMGHNYYLSSDSYKFNWNFTRTARQGTKIQVSRSFASIDHFSCVHP